MNKFIKASHISIWQPIIMFAVLFVFAVAVASITSPSMALTVAAIFAVMWLLVIAAELRIVKTGLSVENGDIYYHGFFKSKKIDPMDMKACVIVKSQGETRFSTYDLKDRNKNPLYSMVFFNNIDRRDIKSIEALGRFYGDMSLQRAYRKKVEFSVIYDEDFVNYVSRLNPEIKIVDLRKN
ncbi:MAG: hypothetical protein J1F63_08250 [Oscillospiraceae bacterium]|nr:hypothetical protein [Oscillospiraceae bacterium]